MDGQVGVQGFRGLTASVAAASVLDLLESSGVPAALVRDSRADADPVEEIDLLAEPLSADLLERSLAHQGYVRMPAWGRAPHRFFLSYAEEADRWLKLDVVTSIAFGRLLEFRIAPAAPFLARASGTGGERRLAVDDEFWTLLLHCLLDKGSIRADHAARLADLSSRVEIEGPGAAVASTALPADVGTTGALMLVRRQDWTSLGAMANPIRRRLTRREPLSVSTHRAANWFLRHLSKLQTIVSRRGLRVVLLGPDGAGKSTLAAALEFPFPSRRLYAGLYPAGSTTRGGPPGFDLVTRLARLRGVSTKARLHQWRGRLVVFDRYTLDARLPAGKPESARTRLRRWLLGHACPLPDLVIVLDAPAELLHARKGEHTLAGLEAQRQRYLSLRGRIPHVVVVDAAREPDDVRRRVTALIWDRYREVWGGAPEPGASFRDG